MEAREREAISTLGAREKAGAPPNLSWLPRQNPAAFRPELGESVREGRIRLFFWTEPFGFFFWSVSPGLLLIGYGTPSTSVVEILRADAERIAERTKAISDPTRLMLLRIIRNFGMYNTQMADYLGIARPTVSIHAKILREAGLIGTRQQGRAAMHTLNPSALRQLFRELEEFLQMSESEE